MNAMAREHAEHTPVANAATQDPRQAVVAEQVVYTTVNGTPVRGYLARPANAGNRALPGLIVIHEWWGLNDNIRMMTRRLAGEGYQALAVDMYTGQVAQTPEQARALTQGVSQNPAAALENLRGAATFLRQQRNAPEIGTIGWCFGGAWSLQAALQMPEQVDAAVVYYGRTEADRARLARLDAPLLGLFGGEDGGIPVEGVRQMEATLKDLGKNAEIQVYPGAKHAFANPSGQAYDAAAAGDAWQRTVAFLGRHLKAAR